MEPFEDPHDNCSNGPTIGTSSALAAFDYPTARAAIVGRVSMHEVKLVGMSTVRGWVVDELDVVWLDGAEV